MGLDLFFRYIAQVFHGPSITSRYISCLMLLLTLHAVKICAEENNIFNATVSKEKTSFQSITQQCKSLGVNRAGNVFTEKSLQLNIKNSGEVREVWLGAYVNYTKWLNLKSCSFGKKLAEGLNISASETPVQDCTRFCENDVHGFVLTGDTCFCRSNVTIYSAGCLATTCGNAKKDFCGKQVPSVNFPCMCQYFYVNFDEREKKVGNCITEQYFGNILRRTNEKCSNIYPYICREGHILTPTAYNDYQNWTESGYKCFRDLNQQYATHSAPSIQAKVWTSVFREQTIFWGTEVSDSNHCVSVVLNGSDVTSIEIRNCNDSLYALCEYSLPQEAALIVANDDAMVTNVVVAVVCVVFIIVVIAVFCVIVRRKKETPSSAASDPENTAPSDVSKENKVNDETNKQLQSVPEQNDGEDIYSKPVKSKPIESTQNNSNGVHQNGITPTQKQNGGNADYDTMANIQSDTYGQIPPPGGPITDKSTLSDYDTMASIQSEEGQYSNIPLNAHKISEPFEVTEYDSNSMII